MGLQLLGLFLVSVLRVYHLASASYMVYSGHSLETFPKEMAAVRDAGHEMFVIAYSARSADIP